MKLYSITELQWEHQQLSGLYEEAKGITAQVIHQQMSMIEYMLRKQGVAA